jgi:hypothetical protein
MLFHSRENDPILDYKRACDVGVEIFTQTEHRGIGGDETDLDILQSLVCIASMISY